MVYGLWCMVSDLRDARGDRVRDNAGGHRQVHLLFQGYQSSISSAVSGVKVTSVSGVEVFGILIQQIPQRFSFEDYHSQVGAAWLAEFADRPRFPAGGPAHLSPREVLT